MKNNTYPKRVGLETIDEINGTTESYLRTLDAQRKIARVNERILVGGYLIIVTIVVIGAAWIWLHFK